MKILWLTWKDYTHPEAGGAEVVLRELSQRLVADGHEVTFLTVRHPGAAAREVLDGIQIIRVGTNRYLHSIQALVHYLRRLRNQFDVIIEVVNTAPYFGTLFKGRAKAFAFYHQLARDIWFYETKRPLSHFGYYVMEPLATWLSSQSRVPLITVSESTRQDLARFGWRKNPAHIISEGIEIEPLANLHDTHKFSRPTMLSLGAMRGMKRTLDQVKAFELAKQHIPQLQLKMAGSSQGEYGQKVLQAIASSPYAADINYLGRVSLNDKIQLMRRAHIICVTSIKEGWGLIVTEAASQGTPAVVYDVDGLRDSVRHNHTGLVTPQHPKALAQAIVQLFGDQDRYESLRRQAWQWSKSITFDQAYKDFRKAAMA